MGFRSRREGRGGFSLIELIVVIGIIVILIAFLLPTIKMAREQATVTQCAANLHAISVALNAYLIESHNTVFWREDPIGINGMDWCVWGGREVGNHNHNQEGLFNRIRPRPLNRWMSNHIDSFHCPGDMIPFAIWVDGSGDEQTRWDDVGNSYHFNADGYPMAEADPATGERPAGHGMGGVKITQVADASRTILFYEACVIPVWHLHWHPHYHGNMCMVDGHVVFTKWQKDSPGEEFLWH